MGLERGCPESGLSCNQGERLEFAPYWPICATSAQQPVNRKYYRIVVKMFGSPNRTRTSDLSVNSAPQRRRSSVEGESTYAVVD